MRVSALLADINVSQKRVADAISLDPVISTRLLSLANSAIYALRGTVTKLTEAVTVIGNTGVSNLLLAVGVSDALGRRILESPAGKGIWIHSVATGLAASEICRFAGMRGADDAFSCGLLHDIGKIILLRADAPLYFDLMKSGEEAGDISAVERNTFGFDHAELGAAAGLHWNLPESVCHIIRYHHEPSNTTAGTALIQLLQTADEFVKGRITDEDPTVFWEKDQLNTFGLSAARFDEIWDNVTLRLANMTNSL